MKRNKKWGKTSQHWSVGFIQEKIKQLCEENDVQLIRVNAAYTSQMCSICGDIHKENRSSEKFLCISCRNEIDADLNAAMNIYNRGVNSPPTSTKHKLLSMF